MKAIATLLTLCLTAFMIVSAAEDMHSLPEEMQKVMTQKKYDHAIWGLYAKDLDTGKALYDLNSEKMFLPASTTKLFSVAALLNAFGVDYRFKTPVYATDSIKNGELHGNLILVAQGDLTLGGRQPSPDAISFTKMDHINANEVPGTILTDEDPLNGLKDLAKQIYDKGLRELDGDVIIDDSLFDKTDLRGTIVSPIIINENLIDIVVSASGVGESAKLTWRPQAPGYTVENEVKTVAQGKELALTITSDETGRKLVVKGTIPSDQQHIVRTFSIKDPKHFARAAFIGALEDQGVKVNLPAESTGLMVQGLKDKKYQQLALLTSPPLSEYAKLILKVSHNVGANLIPLLIASKHEKKTYNEGMQLIGEFLENDVKLPSDAFVLAEAAGANENRFTPITEVKLLEYLHSQSKKEFDSFYAALPILGVDGSLADFAKSTKAVGKVRAKTGTGVGVNLATGNLALYTQALGGYVEGKDGHLIAYMLVVNNATMPTIDDIYAIFEDLSVISSMIYDHTSEAKL